MELKKSLCTAHEKFCFWPDSPCPGWSYRAHIVHSSGFIPLLSPFLLLFFLLVVPVHSLQCIVPLQALPLQSSFTHHKDVETEV